MESINFQLWARNGKIPGGGNLNIRGGFNISGKGLSPNDELYTTFTPLRPIKHRVGYLARGH